MSSSWQAVLIRCRYEPRILPYLLTLVRLALCFWPQTGYLHPDEFFQSPDVIGGEHYESQIQRSWEFTTDKPIRCMLIPFLLNKASFILLRIFSSRPSAHALLVAPRFVYTLSTFLIDFSLYKLCQYYSSRGLWYLPISIIFQTSFICLGCLTRTLSNAIETILFSLLLVVVCQLIKPRFRILFVTPTRSRPAHEQVKMSTQLRSSFSAGFLLALGTFNRPTFPCFAFVPMLYWTFESFKRNSYNPYLNISRVLIPLTFSFSLTALCISSFDAVYYSVEDEPWKILTIAMQLLTKFEFNKLYNHLYTHWPLTPYNFFKYNSNIENLANYTLHAPYVHMVVNIPLAFNVLGLMFYGKLFNLMVGSGVYRLLFSIHRVYALMLLSALTSTILLSFIPHQEFRFLMPLIVPLVYTFAFNIYASKKWLCIWLMINLITTYFYSSIHQSGVLKASLDLDPILKFNAMSRGENRSMIDVLAFRCYLVPSYQWNVPQADQLIRFDLHNTHDDLLESLNDKLDGVIQRHQEYRTNNSCVQHQIYMMLPTLYLNQVNMTINKQLSNNLTVLSSVKQYAPHFSGEDLSNSLAHLRSFGLRSWREAFGFSLLKTRIKDNCESHCTFDCLADYQWNKLLEIES